MKTRNLLSTTFIALLAFASCSSDDATDFRGADKKYIEFSADIEKPNVSSRAAGTVWDAGDAIGIYMKSAGSTLTSTNILNSADNIKHTTTGNGTFKAEVAGIKFPTDGSKVDFISYYPHQISISNYTYPISVADQSDLSKIDLLYSDNASNISGGNSNVTLNFKHKLSQLILKIYTGDGVSSLSGLSLSIDGLITDGSFDLVTSTITKGTTEATLNPNVVVSTNAISSAILVPGDDLSNGRVSFIWDGKIYKWTPNNQVIESGKKYTYSIQLSANGMVILNPDATIEDWTEGNSDGSDIIIVPDKEIFVVDNVSVALASVASTSVLQLTTYNSELWTVTTDQTWITTSPNTGTGSGQITIFAIENIGSERSATVTITPTTATLSAIKVTVTQAAGSVVPPTDNLVFAGSNFNDWQSFINGLNTSGLSSYATQNVTGGRGGSSALHINGIPTKNDFVFNSQSPNTIPTGATKISLYLKGTATGKSLSINVYSSDPSVANNCYKFNLGVCAGDLNIEPAVVNSYAGSIDTNGQWIKITMNIADLALAESGNFFAVKSGKDGVYDLLIDDIVFE